MNRQKFAIKNPNQISRIKDFNEYVNEHGQIIEWRPVTIIMAIPLRS